MGVDRKANTRGGGALERGHGAPLEPLAQLGDALRGVGVLAKAAEAAELVTLQTAQVGSDSVKGRWHESEHLGVVARERALLCGSGKQAELSVLRAWSQRHT